MIVGFVGGYEVGKTTAAKALVEECQIAGRKACRIDFGDFIRGELEEMGYPANELWAAKKKDWVRFLLKGHGEFRRYEDPNYWLDKWERAVMHYEQRGYDIMCSDVRQLNEFNLFKDLGGYVIWLGDFCSDYNLDIIYKYCDEYCSKWPTVDVQMFKRLSEGQGQGSLI